MTLIESQKLGVVLGISPGASGPLRRKTGLIPKATSDALTTICAVSFFWAATQTFLSPSLVSLAAAQPQQLTKSQLDEVEKYNAALARFRSILSKRRAQIDAKRLPNLPGQELYTARVDMMSAYKDLTDSVPSKIGRANKFGIPAAYFDADTESLIDEYRSLFDAMDAPSPNAQSSVTPYKDVVDLGIAIARAKGLDPPTAEVAGRISLGLFFAETDGKQNIRNSRSNTYAGSLQTGVSEDQDGQKKWITIKRQIAEFDSGLIERDKKEETRIGNSDHRLNHWTAVRDALVYAHADLFQQIPAIVRMLPNPIDQMKVFELIQIIPSPTRAALKSETLTTYRISDQRVMGYLRNNSIFAFGRADRTKTSATFREILDAMWLFDSKFQRALDEFNLIKASNK